MAYMQCSVTSLYIAYQELYPFAPLCPAGCMRRSIYSPVPPTSFVLACPCFPWPAAASRLLQKCCSVSALHKKSPAVREGAANAATVIAKPFAVSVLEPIFVNGSIYAALLEAFADNMPTVRTAALILTLYFSLFFMK